MAIVLQDRNHAKAPQGAYSTLREELDRLAAAYPVPESKLVLIISSHMKSKNGTIVAYLATGAERSLRTMSRSHYEIRIALNLLLQFPIERAIETLRHEFAHAWCAYHFDDLSHSFRFREFCTKVGGTMNAHLAGDAWKEASSDDFIKADVNWHYQCKCGAVNCKRRSRFPHSNLCNRYCPKCKELGPQWKLTWLGAGPIPESNDPAVQLANWKTKMAASGPIRISLR